MSSRCQGRKDRRRRSCKDKRSKTGGCGPEPAFDLPAKVKKEGRFTLPARKLYDYARRVGPSSITQARSPWTMSIAARQRSMRVIEYAFCYTRRSPPCTHIDILPLAIRSFKQCCPDRQKKLVRLFHRECHSSGNRVR